MVNGRMFNVFIIAVWIVVILLLASHANLVFKILVYSDNKVLPRWTSASVVSSIVSSYLRKHLDIYVALLAGFATYVIIIVSIFVSSLAVAPLPLPTEIAVIVLLYLLIAVLFNKRYDNAIKLIERITKEKLRTEK